MLKYSRVEKTTVSLCAARYPIKSPSRGPTLLAAKGLRGSSTKEEYSAIETTVVIILAVLALGFVAFILKNYL